MAESFSQHQINVFKDCFNLYDDNHDGKIDKEELTKIMRALGHPVTYIEMSDIMKDHGNESITFPDLLTILANREGKPIAAGHEIFDALTLRDENRNGYISRSDLEHLLTRGGEQMSIQEVDQLLQDFGFDKMFTQINYEELCKRINANSKSF
ncbi:calmodulin-alpha-like [Xenia sp. Carnegie-2017]|uniref:calmodulin-alpha-like n=1 Tax=Xenia sp. Carnegie-2017 TaxID=2897299 RepID=UPI001F03DBA4|nr:calmodulin-alpha-like [Xenia sp. Carnegie-2017]